MASNVFNSTRIDTLNKTNYDTWQIQVQAILIKNDAWTYVSGETEKPALIANDQTSISAYNRWTKADSKAKSDIILTMSPDQLKHLRGCDTSKQV